MGYYEELLKTIPLSECAFKINGIYPDKEIIGFRTNTVFGRESLSIDIENINIGFSDGSRYRKKRDLSRNIQILFDVISDTKSGYFDIIEKMKLLLHQEESKFIFDDDPLVYFKGTVHNIDMSQIDAFGSDAYACSGSINIVCSDPYKYSTVEKIATNNGTNTISIINDGTTECVLSADIEMTSTSGFVALTANDRYIQIGNPEEVDGVITSKTSVKLFDDNFTDDRGWLLNQGILPPTPTKKVSDGTVSYNKGTAPNGYVNATSYGADTANKTWHGPTITKIIPDLDGLYPENWSCQYRFGFEPGSGENLPSFIGHQSITFSDENDNVLISVVIEDVSNTNKRTNLYVYVGDNLVFSVNDATNFYVDQFTNPSGVLNSGGLIQINKLGEQISLSMSYAKINKTFRISNYAATLRKITWYAAKLDSYSPMPINVLRAINVVHHSVVDFKDIPNVFQAGDTININGAPNEIYINDLLNYDMVDIGSQPLLLNPGENIIGIAFSSFSSIPNITITYRERWL